jgi:outer membrane immunogenic protein
LRRRHSRWSIESACAPVAGFPIARFARITASRFEFQTIEGIEMRLLKLAMLAAIGALAIATDGARAADLPYKVAPPAPVYSWSGLYIGANVGYSWGRSTYDATIIAAGTVSHAENLNGFIGGFQSGYNYQAGMWVFGYESDIQFSGEKGGSTFPGVIPGATITTDNKLQWFGTARSRLGFLATPNVLIYGTAGLAYGQVQESATTTITAVGSATATFKDVKAGYAVGGGVEAAFGGGWSGKLEYLYLDLGKTEHSFATPALGTVVSESRRTTDNILRAGINYRWGG